MGLSRKKKSGKKGEVGESAKRVHKKVPGFDAFCVSPSNTQVMSPGL